jgi:hypothetical protein
MLVAMSLACDPQPVQSEVIEGVEDAAPPSSCTAFATCCSQLNADIVSSCEALAAQAGAGTCTAELTLLDGLGECHVALDGGPLLAATGQGDGSAPSRDAAATGDAGVAVACLLLESCCNSPALPSSETATCSGLQSTGDESVCAGLFATLTASNACAGSSAGPGGACPDLQACCTSPAFPSAFLAQCKSTVSVGEDAACQTYLTTFEGAGSCGGAEVIADSGNRHPEDPNCAMLAMCCNEVTFPASTLTTCESIVAANDGGNCLSAYDTYSGALGYCE